MTKEKWLLKVRDNQEVLAKLIKTYHPSVGRKNPEGFIPSAPGAQISCDIASARIAAEDVGKGDPDIRLWTAIQHEDAVEIMELLNATWFGIPESHGSWRIPGFAVSVDLIDEFEQDFDPNWEPPDRDDREYPFAENH